MRFDLESHPQFCASNNDDVDETPRETEKTKALFPPLEQSAALSSQNCKWFAFSKKIRNTAPEKNDHINRYCTKNNGYLLSQKTALNRGTLCFVKSTLFEYVLIFFIYVEIYLWGRETSCEHLQKLIFWFSLVVTTLGSNDCSRELNWVPSY